MYIHTVWLGVWQPPSLSPRVYNTRMFTSFFPSIFFVSMRFASTVYTLPFLQFLLLTVWHMKYIYFRRFNIGKIGCDSVVCNERNRLNYTLLVWVHVIEKAAYKEQETVKIEQASLKLQGKWIYWKHVYVTIVTCIDGPCWAYSWCFVYVYRLCGSHAYQSIWHFCSFFPPA